MMNCELILFRTCDREGRFKIYIARNSFDAEQLYILSYKHWRIVILKNSVLDYSQIVAFCYTTQCWGTLSATGAQGL